MTVRALLAVLLALALLAVFLALLRPTPEGHP